MTQAADIKFVKVLRICSAKTIKEFRAEVANPQSRDYGSSGCKCDGLAVSLLMGETWSPSSSRTAGSDKVCDLMARNTVETLRANLQTARGYAWQFEVAAQDILDWAGRTVGSWPREFVADGVVLKPGATIRGLKKATK